MKELFSKRSILTNKQDYYEKHLEILNPFLPHALTFKERQVLAGFMTFEGELANIDRFNTIYRKKVKTLLNLKDAGLSNYLRTLTEKEVIVENLLGLLEVRPFLFPMKTSQNYSFIIDLKDNVETNNSGTN